MDWKLFSHNLLKLTFSGLILTSVLIVSGCQTVDRTLSMADAKTSYNQGDHKRAFRLSEALAYEGDKDAQYALGYMYFHGIGAPKDQELGVLWINKAAEKGQPQAQSAMKAIHSFQQVVPQYSNNRS